MKHNITAGKLMSIMISLNKTKSLPNQNILTNKIMIKGVNVNLITTKRFMLNADPEHDINGSRHTETEKIWKDLSDGT